MPKTLITVPYVADDGWLDRGITKMKKGIKEGSGPHLLWGAGQFGARGVEGEGGQGTVVGLNQRHGALTEANKGFLSTLGVFMTHDNSSISFHYVGCVRKCRLPGCWHHRWWSPRWWHCQGTPGRSYCGWRKERRDLRGSAKEDSLSKNSFLEKKQFQ